MHIRGMLGWGAGRDSAAQEGKETSWSEGEWTEEQALERMEGGKWDGNMESGVVWMRQAVSKAGPGHLGPTGLNEGFPFTA